MEIKFCCKEMQCYLAEGKFKIGGIGVYNKGSLLKECPFCEEKIIFISYLETTRK